MGLYINKYSGGWRVIEETYKNGKRTCRTVSIDSYTSLGINKQWTVEEAKIKVKAINAKDSDKSRKIKAATRVKAFKVQRSIYLPESSVLRFIQEITNNSFGSKAHQKRLISHWYYICKLIVTLQIEPKDYFDNKERIYHYFLENENSVDYCNKLLRVLNEWGEFVCRDQAQFFKPVPKPRGTIREKIQDTYVDSEGYRGESDPLTPQELQSKQSQLRGDNYNWLLVTIWFGLRPNEVDSLKNERNYRITIVSDTKVLEVYQSKLTSIPRDKRWKPIPCIYEEQKQALTLLIEKSDIKRPLMKTMQRVFKSRITLYGGRKNFLDMMLDRGQSLEDVSMWLGHQSIEMTWRKYRNKKRVSWKVS